MEKYNIILDETVLVDDLPEEGEFKSMSQFEGLIPEGITLLKREDKRGIVIQVSAPTIDKHIEFAPSSRDMFAELFNKEIAPAMYQLGVLLFDAEFPGKYNEFVKMRAKSIALQV